MAPKRKQTAADTSTAASTRVTRSSTRRATAAPPAAKPEPKKKKARTIVNPEEETAAEQPQPPSAKEDPAPKPEVLDGSKTVIIEHCKQCNSFKTRAVQVKTGLEKSVPGVKVLVNPEKPRRGCFEIREEGGDIFVSLLDMKRPFKPMKELDMEQVIEEIVEKIK